MDNPLTILSEALAKRHDNTVEAIFMYRGPGGLHGLKVQHLQVIDGKVIPDPNNHEKARRLVSYYTGQSWDEVWKVIINGRGEE